MRKEKKAYFIFISILILIYSSLSYSGSQKEVQDRLKEIEGTLKDDISIWKLEERDIAEAEKPELDDSSWNEIESGDSLRHKVFWLRHEFRVPAVFSGKRTEGSPIRLACNFRGLGKFEGKLFLNGLLKEQFEIEFGNQVLQKKKEFILSPKARAGEKILIAFRFENLGRLPLVKRKTVEPSTFLQVREARTSFDAAAEAHQLLSRFLYDLKTAFVLLDFKPESKLLPHQKRPVAKSYQESQATPKLRSLKQRFQKALLEFDLEPLRTGDFSKVEKNLNRFYKEIKPISNFVQNYEFFIAGNSHIDLAWLWRWPETVEVTKETFSTIMDNMEEYPEIIYIQSQAQAYQWMEDYYPEVLERIKQKVKEGRWEIVGGMWAEPDCNLIDGESFIRQILYGKRYFKKKFGVEVKLGWNPDSFGYNWNMPQFFKKSGIDAFITQKISWNDTNTFPYFLFWWQGPDGSKVLTYFPPTGYVGRLQGGRMVDGLKQYEKNTGLKKVLILYGLGDHGGGPNREMLDRIQETQEQKIFPRIRHSSASGYLSQLNTGTLESLPVWQDELYLEYHRGTYTTQAETKKFNRKSEVLLSNAEKISSLAFLLGGNYRQKDLNKAWQRVLMNQFHDILPGSSINPVYRDAKESYLQAHKLAKQALQESLGYMAHKINTAGGAEGMPLLVFNTLAWERDGVVKTALPHNLQGEIKIMNPEGQEIPSQILISGEGKRKVCFIARKVPPLGFRIYRIQEGSGSNEQSSLKINETSLENQYFRITINPESGNLSSIFDKLRKREVLAPGAEGNQLQLWEDIPDRWDAWNIGYTGRRWELDKAQNIEITSQGPVMASIKIKKNYLGLSKARREPTTDFPSSFFSQEIVLYDDIPRLDIKMKADWWEDHVLMKVAFPVNVKNEKATYEIPFAFVQRPTGRRTPREQARFEVSAIRWADLSDGDYGISLLNDSKYGHDIKDNVMRLTLLRSPLWPDPMADKGRHQFSYALYPHRGDWKEADTVQRGYEFNTPLLSLLVDNQEGKFPPSFSFFKASPSNIILATVKKAEDRDSLIIRLYETEGKETEGVVEFFRQPKEIFELDLMENRLRSVPFEKNETTLRFGKSEIKSLELVF